MRKSSFAAGCLVLAFCLQAFLAIPKLSATSDEPIHIASGYSYWKTRDFRMEPDTPPTAKLLAAIPLLFLHAKLDTSGPIWANGAAAQSLFGYVFLYDNDADRVLFWSRIPIVLLGALGIVFSFLWARDLFGPAAGIAAAALFAFCPNLLAHGTVVTSDVPVSTFIVMTLYLFWKRCERPSLTADIATGLAIGLAMSTKFSAGILPIIVAILLFTRERWSAFKSLAIMGLCSIFVIEASYLFAVSPLFYFHSVGGVNQYEIKNYPVYLFGELKPGGYWYYFLAAFAVKATAPLLILIALSVLRTFEGFVNRWGEIILLVSLGFVLATTSAVAGQIGIRYLLPIFPLFFVWVSRVVPNLLALRGGKVIVAGLLAWAAFSCVRVFPNYIPYINELAGGPSKGSQLLDDSNIDWGQGLKMAADYVKTRHLDHVTLYSFSPLDNPGYYGLPKNLQPPEVRAQLIGKRPAPGVYIISSHKVLRMAGADPAWKKYQPIDRIGESLWVYSF